MIIGMGALGSAVAELLCRAGTGELTIVDYDIVEARNLGRQSLYTVDDVGVRKVDAAKCHLIGMDPMCVVQALPQPFREISDTTIGAHALVIDATDNLDTRLAINAACRRAGVPLVSGMAHEAQGMAFTAMPSGPCLACILEGKTADDSCDEGIMLAAARMVASVMAMMVLRALRDDPVPALVRVDAQLMQLHHVTVQKTPGCAGCKGTAPVLKERFCAKRRIIADMPKTFDLDRLRGAHIVIHDYHSALRLKVGVGTALVFSHGHVEFEDVGLEEAARFLATLG
jgi:adenylyltransferase/sulfurtransferase